MIGGPAEEGEMEYLAFRSGKTGNRVIIPANASMIIQRTDSVVIYAIGGSGKDRMVWEVPEMSAIHICNSVGQAVSMTIPMPKTVKPPTSSINQYES
ncbi:MAG: hypothetical protein ACOCYV_00335 [Planctomycetota bacterium]